MLEITPKSKIAEILDAYPQLKEKIIALAPQFKKLQNPFLLKTVARMTSLSQAAKVGNIDLTTFVNTLRQHVGQSPLKIETLESSDEPPFWFKSGTIIKSIDARPMLQQGDHPLGLVLQEIQDVSEGQLLELITSFVPAPLIEKVEAKQFFAWTMQKGSEEFHTFFSPK